MSARVTFETTNCAGCRTCEIACSYHHRKLFQPSISSIEIMEIPEKQGFNISFYVKNEGGHLSCDRCKDEEEPLCIKYCNIMVRDELKANLERCFSR